MALVLRGDHELNAVKAQKLDRVASPLTMADPATLREAAGTEAGFAGPVGLDIPVYFDHATANMADFVVGANETDSHYTGVNFGRDIDVPETVDLRNVEAGDPVPGGSGTLSIARGIEVGHIFQLGTKYSEALGAKVLDQDGKERVLEMGCYGIGITRIVAAAIEQNHDDDGIRTRRVAGRQGRPAGRQICGRRADRHSASARGFGARPGQRRTRVPAPPGCGFEEFET